MANHGYVTIKRGKNLTHERLGELLMEINAERFHGRVLIENHEGEEWVVGLERRFFEDGGSYVIGAPCWVRSPRTVEFRHSVRGDFHWWVWEVVINEVARKLGGRIRDDGVGGETWEPQVDYLPTFWDWEERSLRYVDPDHYQRLLTYKREFYNLYKERHGKDFPEAFEESDKVLAERFPGC